MGTTTLSSLVGCSDADLIVALVDVPSADICAEGCSKYEEPEWLGSTTLSPAGCQHSVWKPSGECRLYRTTCSGEASKTSGWYAAGRSRAVTMPAQPKDCSATKPI